MKKDEREKLGDSKDGWYVPCGNGMRGSVGAFEYIVVGMRGRTNRAEATVGGRRLGDVPGVFRGAGDSLLSRAVFVPAPRLCPYILHLVGLDG